MSLDDILDRRLLIISGKGGVGKTTAAAALAALAARHGRTVLLCEVEGKRGLSRLFGTENLTESPRPLSRNLYGMNISAEDALREYFEVQFHMKRIARPLIASQLVYYVTHAAPGLRDILMLGKVWFEATRKKRFDLLVLDTPAAGHAVSMLRSPQGFLDAVPVGPLAGHARGLAEWLKDPQEVSIHLVSMAEEMPVTETLETMELLEERMGLDVTTVIVNKIYQPLGEDPSPLEDPEPQQLIELAEEAGAKLEAADAEALVDCARFYGARRRLQQDHLSRLRKSVSESGSTVELPFLFTHTFARPEIDELSEIMEAQLA